jgi:cysteinyl-tRNA synthetase
MKLYNTLTRQTEDLTPLAPPAVTMYTCGPTVYDYAHIGHWFTYVRWDTVVRVLRANGLEPKWVMNITDVGHLVSDADEGEDKLEKGARREGKTAWEVAEFYTQDFVECMKLLNMLEPNEMPRATQHIPEQIELIKQLEEKGYTYVIGDGVYYDTSKFEGYAAFARLDLDDQQAGARVEVNPEKRNPTDFALWKFSPKDQQRDMEWDSPWGKGFPGWHIECSAMSMKYLGETLDIHTGGIDHIPVHHTNEIAQSEPATGKRFANLWMHANHVLVNDEKISKSLGNGIRLQAVIEKGYSPMVVRLHILESHYRSQSKFSWDSLDAAKNRLANYYRLADLQFQPKEVGAWLQASNHMSDLVKAMEDDLNTPLALSHLSALASEAEEKLVNNDEVEQLRQVLQKLDDLLGLDLPARQDISAEQKELINQREQARQAKDWAKSDELRNQLTSQGIGLRDTSHGAIWYRA